MGIICDEEGKINGKELNRALRDDEGKIYDIVAGPFLVVGLSDEDFASLSKDLSAKYSKLFEYPETFYRDGNEIKAVKIDVQEIVHKPKRGR